MTCAHFQSVKGSSEESTRKKEVNAHIPLSPVDISLIKYLFMWNERETWAHTIIWLSRVNPNHGSAHLNIWDTHSKRNRKRGRSYICVEVIWQRSLNSNVKKRSVSAAKQWFSQLTLYFYPSIHQTIISVHSALDVLLDVLCHMVSQYMRTQWLVLVYF